jgi:hypothetical protein
MPEREGERSGILVIREPGLRGGSVGRCRYPAEPLTLTATVPLGRPGSEPAPGNPGSEPAPGRLGSPGSEPAPGRLGRPGTEVAEGSPEPEPLEDDPGDDPVEGADGRPEGGVTQTVTPFVLDACTDPPPAGLVRLPPPETLPGAGIAGAAGVLTH